jgi:hypothetical protein
MADAVDDPANIASGLDRSRLFFVLDALPGHREFLDSAAEIGAPPPERARRAARFGM